MKITTERISIELNETTLAIALDVPETRWKGVQGFVPIFYTGEQKHAFTELSARHEEVRNGVGHGIRSCFGDAFETFVWVEEATDDVRFEWIPLEGAKRLGITRVEWPAPLEFGEAGSAASTDSSWYTVLPNGQGLLIPNDWPEPYGPTPFGGRFLTQDAYMPWFGQVRDGFGYIAIAETPWDGGMKVVHDQPGETLVRVYWDASLGQMDYVRRLRFSFRQNASYNNLAKIYRLYMMENGTAATLKEKEARLSSVADLVGSAFVHCGIKTHVNPKSSFFDPAEPEKNNRLTSFEQRLKEMEAYHEKGVRKLFLHLDGWAEPGYDNNHPDYAPVCEEAGGPWGMRALIDGLHRCGYLFGIHDQYRDYYEAAESYDADYAVRLPDGTVPSHARWAGGPQSYLCASFVPYYLRRNFMELIMQGLRPDGAYLDVFTCNEGDECANPRHRMSRRECYEYRLRCFDWLLSKGILPSSEEVADWSLRSLVFCHYAPYTFQLEKPGKPRQGVPIPLFNLVYHDCVIIPWMMEKHETEDYMLYALLNGGAPYLRRDPAYVGVDGAFEGEEMTVEETIRRTEVVAGLHEKIAYCEMVAHRFLGSYEEQESIFSDGTRVRIHLATGEYEIL